MRPLLLIMGLLAFPAKGQSIGGKIRSLSLTENIVSAAIDRPGDFYAVTSAGHIQRFEGGTGRLSLLYKAPSVPTLFDPRDGARLFLYYRDAQEYQYVTPSFEPLASDRVDPAFAIQPWLICPSGEYNLWILDSADQSLKKVNVRESHVELEVYVDSTLIGHVSHFTTMREYQNFVFLLDPAQGILIFNSLGKHLKTVPARGIQHFNFLGEELYFLDNGQIAFFNLFTAETRRLQVKSGYSGVLLTDERMMLFTPRQIDIFSFRP